MTSELGQVFLFGIFIGALYGLAAIGFSFVFGVMKVLNIAHGSLLMLGAYGSFWLFTLCHIDPYLSIPLVATGVFLIGLAMYKGLLASLIKLPETLKINISLMVAFGVILILDNLAVMLFTADERSITPSYSGSGIELLGMVLPFTRLAALGLTILVILALQQFLRRTYFGKSIRAVAQNWESASLVGINVQRTYLASFGLSAILASIAGALVGIGCAISPGMGLEWTLKAMIVVCLAGMGSMGGTLVAGLILGVVESLSALFIGPYMEAVGLIILLVVISLRPQGLFGSRPI